MFDERRTNLPLRATTRNEALAELVQASALSHWIDDTQVLTRSLLAQDGSHLFLAGGAGEDDPAIALIHAGSECVSTPFACLGLSREGVAFLDPFRDRVRMILVLVFPMYEFASSVWGVTRLARWLRKREVRLSLCQATSPAEAALRLDRAWAGKPTETRLPRQGAARGSCDGPGAKLPGGR
jgi:mannitol/fructose-specific phosphotransferase system IIA component (Ntr-type)